MGWCKIPIDERKFPPNLRIGSPFADGGERKREKREKKNIFPAQESVNITKRRVPKREKGECDGYFGQATFVSIHTTDRLFNPFHEKSFN